MSRARPNQQTTAKKLEAIAGGCGVPALEYVLGLYQQNPMGWAGVASSLGISESSLRRYVRNSPLRLPRKEVA